MPSETVELKLNAEPTACFVQQDGNLVMALSNGEVSLIAASGDKIKTRISPQPGVRYHSIAPQSSSVNGLWLLEENQKEVYYSNFDNTLQKVAKLAQNGHLLQDSEGVLYLSESGKRFLLQQEQTGIFDWPKY